MPGKTFPSSSVSSAVSLPLWDLKYQTELDRPVNNTWNVRSQTQKEAAGKCQMELGLVMRICGSLTQTA